MSYLVTTGKYHVYRACTEVGEMLYVGLTCCLHQRLQQHQSSPWYPQAAYIAVRHYDALDAATADEHELITQHWPPFNKGTPKYTDSFPDKMVYELPIAFIPIKVEPTVTHDEHEYLVGADAARLIGISAEAFRQWVKRGHIHPIRVNNRLSWFRRSELLALQASPPRRSGRPKKERSQ